MNIEKNLERWAKGALVADILPFWAAHARDKSNGGFFGHIGNDGVGDPSVSRSIVMNSRYLWSYSAAYLMLGDEALLEIAHYAWREMVEHYVDPANGGCYWSVKPDGMPDVLKKQIYGEAFALYSTAEYARALYKAKQREGSEAAFELALEFYELLETHARDFEAGGYFEARAIDWKPTADLKLSKKDIDCDKSMNTNLHVMEALSNLYRTVLVLRPRDAGLHERVAESLRSLVLVTVEKILGPDAHLDLYFNRDWSVIGEAVSYGHDIEASWLLWEAVELLDDEGLEQRLRLEVLRIAETSYASALDQASGGFENEFHHGVQDRTRVWWCQAEALVGFVNAWQMTGEDKWLAAAVKVRDWIENFQRDKTGGDWFASVSPEGKPDLAEPKGGNWKTSYHNARCCMELLSRIG